MGAKIVHERDICVGCSICSSMSANFWELNMKDGKVDLKGAKKEGNNFELAIQEADIQANKDAAEGCPVKCIRVFDSKGEKLV